MEESHDDEIETVAAWLCAAGQTNKRIAQTIGKSESWVKALVQQKSFHGRVLAILKERLGHEPDRFYPQTVLIEMKK